MTQTFSVPMQDAGLLGNSQRIIAMLENQRGVPAISRALHQHYEIHTSLEEYQQTCEAAMQMWHRATTVRWQWEVAGQRLYNQIQHMLITQYGADSAQVQAITPHPCAGSSADVLHTLQRTRAALRLSSPCPVEQSVVSELDDVCVRLDHAIRVAQEYRQEWREAVLSQRVVEQAYQHALHDTSTLLEPLLEQPARAELRQLQQDLIAGTDD